MIKYDSLTIIKSTSFIILFLILAATLFMFMRTKNYKLLIIDLIAFVSLVALLINYVSNPWWVFIGQ